MDSKKIFFVDPPDKDIGAKDSPYPLPHPLRCNDYRDCLLFGKIVKAKGILQPEVGWLEAKHQPGRVIVHGVIAFCQPFYLSAGHQPPDTLFCVLAPGLPGFYYVADRCIANYRASLKQPQYLSEIFLLPHCEIYPRSEDHTSEL